MKIETIILMVKIVVEFLLVFDFHTVVGSLSASVASVWK
jgi:hypothetical protein